MFFFLSTGTDLIPGMGAFIACLLLPLELGILAGIAINVIFILYHAARPKISIEFLSVNENKQCQFDCNKTAEPNKRINLLIALCLFDFFLDCCWWQIFDVNTRSLLDLSIR